MRKLSKNIVDFILNEIKILKKDGVITEDIEIKITSYYNEILKNSEEPKIKTDMIKKEKTGHRAFALIVLSIIAAIFIAIGIITFIAINWAHIPREIKTIFAFILLLIPSGLSFYKIIIRNNNYSKQFSEGVSIFWALMFGGVFSFISQIYRISTGDLSQFLLIWLLSTLGILYIFQSVSTSIFYAILLINWTWLSQYENQQAVLFYPLLAGIIPLIFKKGISDSKKIFFGYIFIIVSLSCLGVAFEKTLTGIWILGYGFIIYIYRMIGDIYENREENIFKTPFRLTGFIGSIALLFIFMFNWVWKDIGVIKKGMDYIMYGTIVDYTVVTLLFIISLIFMYVKFFTKKEISLLNIIASLFILLLPILYILNSFKIINHEISSFIITISALLSFIILTIYNLINKNLNKTIVALLLTSGVILKIIIQIPDYFIIILSSYFIFIFIVSILGEENFNIFRSIKILSTLSIFILSSLSILFFYIFSKDINPIKWNNIIILNFISLLMLLVFSIVGFIYYIYKKKSITDFDLITLIDGFFSLFLSFFTYSNHLKIENFIFILSIFFCFIILYSVFKDLLIKNSVFSELIILLLPLPIIIYGIMRYSFVWTFLVSGFFSMLYYFSLYQNKKTESNNLFFLEIIGIVLSTVFLFIFSFSNISKYLVEYKFLENPSTLNLILFGSITFVSQIAFIIDLIRKKIIINYFIIGLPLLLFVITFIKKFTDNCISPLLINWIINIIILLLCLNFFAIGVKKRSIAIINIFAIFLILTFIIRFFELDVNLLIKALVFFISGIIILIVNIILSYIFKKGVKENEIK
ncbi:MAG TPA: DUF2157 domain-containing protein [Spirochaetota bacterium]|nr:DUF2157 domain-containing protein [Spirochaetota bacterium]HPP05233.1 DUF2157 domain-containing protein [Spirochaetota bacterium]